MKLSLFIVALVPYKRTRKKKKGIDKLIIAAHLSIKMRLSLWHKSDFFKQCQMNARSNNANLVLILRNPLLFSEGIHKSWPPSPQGFIKKHDLCACWGRHRCDVHCYSNSNTAFLEFESLPPPNLLHPPLSLFIFSPPGPCRSYHEQHLVIFNYDPGSDQPLMGLEVTGISGEKT